MCKTSEEPLKASRLKLIHGSNSLSIEWKHSFTIWKGGLSSQRIVWPNRSKLALCKKKRNPVPSRPGWELWNTVSLKSRGGSTGFHSYLGMVAASTATVVDVTTERLVNLRKVMKEDGMDCIIVPTEDPHMSEYTAPYYYRREFISGFTGDEPFLSDTSC